MELTFSDLTLLSISHGTLTEEEFTRDFLPPVGEWTRKVILGRHSAIRRNDLVEDAVQEVVALLLVVLVRRRLRASSSPAGWVAQIIRRKLIHISRGLTAQRERTMATVDHLARSLVSRREALDCDDTVQRLREAIPILDRELDGKSPAALQMFRQRFRDHMRLKEIAEIHSCSIAKVHKSLAKVIARLAEICNSGGR